MRDFSLRSALTLVLEGLKRKGQTGVDRFCQSTVNYVRGVLLPALVVAGLVGPAMAADHPSDAAHQDNSGPLITNQPSSRPSITNEEAEQIRGILRGILQDAVDRGAASGDDVTIERAEFGLDVLGALTNEDLAVYIDVMPMLPLLNDVEDLQSEDARNRSSVTSAEGPWAATSGLPGAGYSGECPAGSRVDLFASLTAVQVTQLIWVAADHLCNFNFTTILPPPPLNSNASLACIVTDVLLLGVQSDYEFEKFCNDDVNSAEVLGLYDRLAHIHTDLNNFRFKFFSQSASDSSIYTNELTIGIFRNDVLTAWDEFKNRILGAIADLGAKVESLIISEFEIQNLEMRTFRARNARVLIGKDLGSVSSLGRIASYQLPGSFVCDPPVDNVPCGSLEDVQKSLAETIAAMKAANQDVFDAPGLMVKGDHAFANGDYRQAHDFYSQAYRMATSFNGRL